MTKSGLRTKIVPLRVRTLILRLLAVVVFAVVAALPEESFAYPVTFTFQDASGRKIPAIKIRGTYGLNSLPILTSDANGQWSFDTNDVTSTDAVVAFSGFNAGVALEPAEVSVAELVAQGVHAKTILATSSASPNVLISWSYFSSYTGRLAGMPVALLNPYRYSCETRRTDSNGYVVWSVRKPSGVCNDGTPDTSWYHIVPAEDANVRCSSFVTARTVGARACPFNGDDEQGFSTSSCGVVSPPAPTLASIMKISVTTAGTAYGVPGVEIVGNANLMSLAARQTNSVGDFSFTIGSIPGAQASTGFEVSLVKAGYEFYPRVRNTRECAFAGANTFLCRFSAVRTDAAQGVVVADVTQAGQPITGAAVNPPLGLGCLPPQPRFSDSKGRIVLPVRTRRQCGSNGSWDAPVAIYPSLPGKGFTSSTSFLYCPTSLITSAPISGYENNSAVQNYLLRGRVLNLVGAGLSGVEILVDGQSAVTTDASGGFQLPPIAQGATVKVEARAGTYKFDPAYETFLEVGNDVQTVIRARAPDPIVGDIDPPKTTCPIQAEYSVKGLVLDISGRPRPGTQIFLDDRSAPVAITDSTGRYSFALPYGKDAWVRAESGSSTYGPAGRALTDTVCDEVDVDFQEVDYQSAVVSGRVVDANDVAMGGVALGVKVNGLPLSYAVDTSAEGNFRFTAPQGSVVVVKPDSSEYSFAPLSAEEEVVADETLVTFVADRSSVPTPQPTPPQAPSPTIPPGSGTPLPPSAPPSTPIPPAPPAETAPALPTNPGGQPIGSTPVPTVPVAPPVPTLQPPISPPLPPQGPPTVPSPQPTLTLPLPLPPGGVQPTVAPTAMPQPPQGPTIQPPPATPPGGIIPTAVPTSPVRPGEPTQPIPPQPTSPPVEILPQVIVAALCNAGEQGDTLPWVVRNTGVVPLKGQWSGVDVSQPNYVADSGLLEIAPGEEKLLLTGRNGLSALLYRLRIVTMTLSGDSLVVAYQQWQPLNCLALRPTPTPLPIVTPTPEPPAVPGNPPTNPPPGGGQPPSNPPVQPPPVSTVAPLPTVTPTPSPTPDPLFKVSGAIRDGNGRRITQRALAKLVALSAQIEIKGRLGNQFAQTIPFRELSGDTYQVDVPAGSYQISVQGPRNSLRVTSVFGNKKSARYICSVPSRKSECRNVTFAVTPLALLGGGGRQ